MLLHAMPLIICLFWEMMLQLSLPLDLNMRAQMDLAVHLH